MNPLALAHIEPAAVDFRLRDGLGGSIMFATRIDAELFLASIPAMQLAGNEWFLLIARARIRQLGVGVN